MDGRRFLTFDFGAESGRAVMGELDAGRLILSEIHRFPNEPALADLTGARAAVIATAGHSRRFSIPGIPTS